MTFEYALYEMSYENFLLYSAAIPSYNIKKKGGKDGQIEKDKVIKADDPKNKDLVKAIINGYKF